MNFEELKNKSISLIVWNTEKEEDVYVYLGKLNFENGNYYFINQEKGWRISLDEEQLSNMKPVSDDLKEMLLDADFALSMSMGSLPSTDISAFQSTGINWLE